MPSLHDSLMQSIGVPALMEWNGDFAPVTYFAPKDASNTHWQAIIGSLSLGIVDEFNGGSHQQQEQREELLLRGPRPAVPFVRQGSFAVPQHPGERFSIESIETTGSMVSVRVFRHAAENSQRRGVERGK